MKKVTVFILIIALIFILVGCSTSRHEKIGLLNMKKVMNKSKRAEHLQQELEDIGNKLQGQYKNKENQGSGKAGDQDKQNLDQIYQKYVDNKQHLEDELNQDIQKIIKNISRKDHLDVVLYNSDVYYGGQDITDQVIKKLDENYTEGGDSNNDKGKTQ